MKKWLIVAVVAGLGAGIGCETPEAQQAEAQNAKQEQAEQAEQNEQAEQAEQKQAPSAEKGADPTKSGLAEDLADGESGTYGGEFTVEGEPITLAAAMQQSAEGEGPFKISAAIDKVCKKKGCWFTLASEGVDAPVRVRMKDYGFFVPRNADGAQAVVEGTLKKRVIPQKEAQHYADDEAAGSDKAPEKVEGDKVEWEMIITAAKISKS